LDKATQQVENFKKHAHYDISLAEFDKMQKAYWTDIYNKLLLLKKMSILLEKTSIKRCLSLAKEFENLHLLNMTRIDDEDITRARNSLEMVIHSMT